jgi:serine/threonine protein phosphatase 1
VTRGAPWIWRCLPLSGARLNPRRSSPVERVYAIGDIHGRLDLFGELIAQIERDGIERGPAPTRIVLLGDIVDRGPDSATLVHGLMQATAMNDRIVVLKGNHEWMMAEALGGGYEAFAPWLRHGGRETLMSWGMDPDDLDCGGLDGHELADLCDTARDLVGPQVIGWLSRLPLTLRFRHYLFVHAGIRPGRRLSRQVEDDLLWITGEFLESTEDHGVTVVHGHSIGETGPVIRPNRIGIDTGAFRTGMLTAMGIEAGDEWLLSTEPTAMMPCDSRLALVG